jgi:DNA-binding NarL/FixJ family response regulator
MTHGREQVKRLLIIADNSFAAQSIRLALRQTAEFNVIGFVDGSTSISHKAVELIPDIVVVDETDEPNHAIARLKELKLHLPDAKRVILMMHMDDNRLADVFDAGAEAVISKAVHPVSLAMLLREISRGTVVHRPCKMVSKTTRENCPLTDRELELLRLVAQGYTNARIGRELGVTEQTVKFHLSNTYRKLGVANRTEASRYAHVNDLLVA